jgi:hypothetical protein
MSASTRIPRAVSRIALAVSMLATFGDAVGAQESADQLTRDEARCQGVTSAAVGKYGDRVADCLADCQAALATDPSRRCNPFGFNGLDGKTASCLGVAEARAVLEAARPCTGAPCPECYAHASCQLFTEDLLSNLEQLLASATSSLFCSDAFFNGQTPAETACQQTAFRGIGKLYRMIGRCIGKCQRAGVAGGACFGNDQTPVPLDPGLERCVDRARLRFLGRCAKGCADPPECSPINCEGIYQQVHTAFSSPFGALDGLACVDHTVCGDGFVSGNEQCDTALFPNGCGGATPICGQQCQCEPVPVCGDGQVTGSEPCDGSAMPSGCFGSTICRFCSFCAFPFCGDGIVTAPEECEPSGPPTCGASEACDGTCMCQPVVDACSPDQVQQLPAAGGIVTGTTFGLSSQSGTCGVSPSPERAFSWTPTLSGTAVADVCSPGNFFHSLVYVRQGTCTGAQVVCADHSFPPECGINHGGRATFPVTAGTTYYIFVDGWGGESGAFTLRVNPPSSSPSGAFLD